MGYEKVFTVDDYYGGPRSGIANYRDAAHAYACEWSDVDDDYSDTFVLRPLDAATFSLAMDAWDIWKQWRAGFHRGEVGPETHPALPGQNARFAELTARVAERVASIVESRKAVANFRPLPGEVVPGAMREFEVEWKDAS